MGEFDFIGRLQQRLAEQPFNAGIDVGIGDDAAILSPPPDHRLVVTADTLNAGVHFPHCTAPYDIGYKTLAVNLSDLAAMGAEPWACTLTVGLPSLDPAWMESWLDGFLAAAQLGGITLIGGDTTRAPFATFGVTAMGLLPSDAAAGNGGLRRANALAGDDVWVSGELGGAALALRLGEAAPADLRLRLDRPIPRLALGSALRLVPDIGGCCDVSDGLLADLGHIAMASGVRIELDADRIPVGMDVRSVSDGLMLALTGGDDYELAFTAAASAREQVLAAGEETGVAVTRIGRALGGEPGVHVLDPMGREVPVPPRAGWDHFAATAD